MKNLLLSLVLGLVLLPLSAQAAISEPDCMNWRRYINDRTSDNSEVLPNLLIELEEAQLQAIAWVKTDLRVWGWDVFKRMDDATYSTWALHDQEFVSAIKSCVDAIKHKKDPGERDAFLRKAELHIERAIRELNKIHTVNRIPTISHGGILPGNTKAGEASDYLESKFIPKFVNGILVLLISLSVIMLIVSGLMFLFAGGDSELVTRAKTMTSWSIVGVVITILSYSIVQFIIGIDFSL